MAIYFPQEVPIKWFTYNDRLLAAAYPEQVADFRGDFHGQFVDSRTNDRVIILDDTFAPIGELTGDAFDRQLIGGESVYTFFVDWSQFGVVGDKLYLGAVDANTNKYFQNFLPNGTFNSTDNWTLGANTTITGGELVFTIGGAGSSTTTYDIPFKDGAKYDFVIDATFSTGGTTVITLKDGATTVGTLSNGEGDTASGTFTVTDGNFSLVFSTDAACTVEVQTVAIEMNYEDVIPEWVSAPFCVKDAQEGTFTIHGCAASDMFNMYFESTGFVPRVLVEAELREAPAQQDIESYFSTSGKIRNYFVQHVSQKQLNVDFFPAYLIHFLQVVFMLDSAQIENIEYTAVEQPEIIQDDNLEDEAQMTALLALKNRAVGYKRIVNDPDTASCTVPSGAYLSQIDATQYQQQGTSEVYYPQ